MTFPLVPELITTKRSPRVQELPVRFARRLKHIERVEKWATWQRFASKTRRNKAKKGTDVTPAVGPCWDSVVISGPIRCIHLEEDLYFHIEKGEFSASYLSLLEGKTHTIVRATRPSSRVWQGNDPGARWSPHHAYSILQRVAAWQQDIPIDGCLWKRQWH